WLLVQHADQDPVLQFRTLKLMEPVIAKGEASAKMYGYLYDRVMLKLAGKQRFGTQMHCEGGKMAPLPLEDPAKLDPFRKEADRVPMADYEKLFADNRC